MISNKELLEYIKKLDQKLNKKIRIIAVGGTAMVLMNLKESTIDVDFCIDNKENYDIIRKIRIKSPFKVDLFHSGYIFTLQLPEDCIKRARTYKTGLKNIILKVLSPIDIIITKGSRLNQRDIEDIGTLMKKKKISKRDLVSRFNKVKESWPSSDEQLEQNIRFILKEFF
ncbi:MAG: hypothetical protein KKE20_03660 [Nanoarchaeota archaeon]|nr:hypothetical protein [Nanoarchaeota archaeon]